MLRPVQIGQQVLSKHLVLEILEAVRDFDPSSKIPFFLTLAELLLYLHVHNVAQGRIGTTIILPADWKRDGHYIKKHLPADH